MSKAGHLSCAPLALATLVFSVAANAERAHDAFGSAAAHSARSPLIVAQTSHAPPGVPGSSGAGGSSNGSHAPPPVPGSTDLGGATDLGRGSSGGSHAPPPVPGATNSGGASGGSHAPPPVPGAAVSSGGNPPMPNAAGQSHAPPQVPLMGGNP